VEGKFSGDEMAYEVGYDNNNLVDEVMAFKGSWMLGFRYFVFAMCTRLGTRQSAHAVAPTHDANGYPFGRNHHWKDNRT
jgi:hypothetical protein